MQTTAGFASHDSMRPWSLAIVLPLVGWCIAVWAVDPRGDFPLNDDWSYALAVRHLLDTGEFRPLGWTTMTLVGHALWGALFGAAFGDSFDTLRASTLVAALLGLLSFALLLSRFGCDRWTVAIATASLGFNPLFFSLSATFMTDVGFTSAAIVSTLFFCRYLQTRRARDMIVACVVAFVALSIRQLALYLPAAMLLTLLLEPRRDRVAIVLALVGLAGCVASFKGFELWLAVRHATPVAYRLPYETLKASVASARALAIALETHVRGVLVYLGWFCAPLLCVRAPAIATRFGRGRRARVAVAATLAAGFALGVLMVVFHHRVPAAPNIAHTSGVGPIILNGWPAPPKLPPLPAAFWIFTTLVAASAAALLVLDIVWTSWAVLRTLRRRAHDDAAASARAFLLIGCAIYLLPFLMTGYFDRYLLPPVFMMLAMTALPATRGERHAHDAHDERTARAFSTLPVRALCVAVLSVMTWYTVAGTHDYLGWNRARWALLDRLVQRGIAPASVDGGLEFNGLYLYDPAYVPGPDGRFWWVRDDRFIVDFGPHAGYRTIDEANVDGWLPPFRTKMLTLERDRTKR